MVVTSEALNWQPVIQHVSSLSFVVLTICRIIIIYLESQLWTECGVMYSIVVYLDLHRLCSLIASMLCTVFIHFDVGVSVTRRAVQMYWVAQRPGYLVHVSRKSCRYALACNYASFWMIFKNSFNVRPMSHCDFMTRFCHTSVQLYRKIV